MSSNPINGLSLEDVLGPVNVVDYQDFTTKDTPKAERNELGVGDTWSNSVKCLACGDTIRSRNRHDYVRCSCGNIAVDGGSWYMKRVGGVQGYEELSEAYTDQGDEDE